MKVCHAYAAVQKDDSCMPDPTKMFARACSAFLAAVAAVERQRGAAGTAHGSNTPWAWLSAANGAAEQSNWVSHKKKRTEWLSLVQMYIKIKRIVYKLIIQIKFQFYRYVA